MGQVIWTEPALADLHQIIRYVARKAPATAIKLGQRLVRAPQRLARFPRSGPIVTEFENEAVRELLVGSYRLIYAIRGQDCHVVAVVHAQRDIANLLRIEELGDN